MWGAEDIWLVALGILAVAISSIMYMMGGTAGFGKFWRRFIGAFVLACAASGLALVKGVWSWQFIFVFPGLIGGFSLPYGASTFWEKVLKRIVFALGTIAAGFFGYWAMHFPAFGLGILAFQVFIGLGSIYLGVVNPYNNAPLEQGLISILLTLTIPFWCFVK